MKKIIQIMVMLLAFSCEKHDANPANEKENDTLTETSSYPIVGTNQTIFYGNYSEISTPKVGEDFFGQDAQYTGNTPKYKDNKNGTITDLVTGLTWAQTPDLNDDGEIDISDKLTYEEALNAASSFKQGGYTDWRLPTIKELYSLIIFSGKDVSGYEGSSMNNMTPFINTDYFEFGYGDTEAGERIIDAQFATSTLYKSTTMNNAATMFGVNFADGRIKGYPIEAMPGQSHGKLFYVLYVRGNDDYGKNNFTDNGDGTIIDNATGLMWMQNDNAQGVTWQEALDYAENSDFAGYSDWRLPTIKELQSIVDYSRSPATTSSAAIDEMFNCTQITNEAGQKDFPCYWSGTTHANWTQDQSGAYAAYISFGRAMGYMMNLGGWIDVHGAGAQRSDNKTGNPEYYPYGHGPQGDAIRIYNYVRCVRNVK